MKIVYSAPASSKAKLTAILEADPYAHPSFSRNGYKVKDGSSLGEDKANIYLYLKCEEEVAKMAEEKLKDVAAKVPADVTERVIKKIEDEENSAEAGFGAIFG
ncbi:hypothetical protein J4441_02845 [Candidatus Micrarchaeota archaeon]|nr:hypothetical protein [Candidatus Micrarchaeota archaeon]